MKLGAEQLWTIDTLNSKVAALEQLLEVYESSVLEQAEALYGEIAKQKRAREEALARNAEELASINAELKLLLKISNVVNRNFNVEEFVPQTLAILLEMERFQLDQRAMVFLLDDGDLRPALPGDLPDPALDRCRERQRGACPCTIAARTGEIAVVSYKSDGEEDQSCPLAPRHSQIIVPLKACDAVVGVLSLYTKAAGSIEESSFPLLCAVGEQLGVAITNARFYGDAQRGSLHDYLTGLPNRRFMDLQIEKNFEAAKRYGSALSVIMLDIDHFKRFNDTFGHQEGDHLLACLARTLQKIVRKSEYLFRYGGEEFLCMLPETDLAAACTVAERLRLTVEAETRTTISLGVASYHDGTPDSAALLKRADDALYRAKQNGRNRVEASGGGTEPAS